MAPRKQLVVRIGSDFDRNTQVEAPVNDERNPILVNSPYFTGSICMRINSFKGKVGSISSSENLSSDANELPKADKYFDGKRRCFSLQIQGRFKQEWPANDVEFGIVLDSKLKLPWGADMALKIAQVRRLRAYFKISIRLKTF
jgi:hypothetical protein